MKRLTVFVGIAALLTACGSDDSSAPSATDGAEKTVVTSAYPLYEAVANVGGKRVKVSEVASLTAFTDEPLTDKDRTKLNDADIAVILGDNTQPRIEAAAAQRANKTVSVLDNIETKSFSAASGKTGTNPYVWLDPGLMGQVIDATQATLSAAEPENAAFFAKNALDYRKSIAGVDGAFAHDLAGCERKDVLTTNPVFDYMTRRYGLNQVAVAAEGLAPGEGRVAPADAADGYAATTLFFANLPDTQAARKLRDDFKLRAAVLDPVAVRTDQARRGGASYSSTMNLNLDALMAGLGCPQSLGGK